MRAPKKLMIFQKKLNLSKDLTRFATPEKVARYRAERLKCKNLVEIGSGIGGQTIAFSNKYENVLCIELNPKSAKTAKENIEKLKIKNVKIIIGDALDIKIINEVKKFRPDIIFCDTERPEKSERTISGIKPDIKKFLKEYMNISEKIAVEIPPFTKDTDKLECDFEKEFISLDGKLNRLTLYFNSLKNSEVSVVEIESGEKISGTPKKIVYQNELKNFAYLGVINPAVTLSGLTENLAEKTNSKIILLEEKEYLLSDKPAKTSFAEYFKIRGFSKIKKSEIIKKLKELDAKSAVIRYKISPEDYWKERTEYEKNLDGKNKIHLFRHKDEIVFCEKI